MPGAQCTRSLVRAEGSEYAHEYSQRRHRITSGIPHAMVLTVSFVLFPATGFLATVTGAVFCADLTPASGRQNHTTSPSACARPRQKRQSVHRIPPHVRDDRETPLCWDGIANQYSCFYPAVNQNSEIPKLTKAERRAPAAKSPEAKAPGFSIYQ